MVSTSKAMGQTYIVPLKERWSIWQSFLLVHVQTCIVPWNERLSIWQYILPGHVQLCKLDVDLINRSFAITIKLPQVSCHDLKLLQVSLQKKKMLFSGALFMLNLFCLRERSWLCQLGILSIHTFQHPLRFLFCGRNNIPNAQSISLYLRTDSKGEVEFIRYLFILQDTSQSEKVNLKKINMLAD